MNEMNIEWLVVIMLVINAILDIKYRKISILACAITGIVALVCLCTKNSSQEVQDWWQLLGVLPGIALLLCSIASRGAVGMGDGFVVMAIGVQLGFWPCFTVLIASLFLSSQVGVILIWRKKGNKKTELPFVPFLFLSYVGGVIWWM